ncbi:MAG: TIGR01459 family HAD-type hydrolase [Pseudooceanicola sp.]|nr:TIGR01459 family HAD-type hydrolase [Pseudooceanicola sp.]
MGFGQGAERDHLTPEDAFAAYEAVRARLPDASRPGACVRAGSLDDLAGDFDVFLLDAFGVLNIGETAIPGVVDRIAGLKARGKRVLVVTNAAGHPHAKLLERYTRLGYDFDPADVISSRAALVAGLSAGPSRNWGMMASAGYGLGEADGVIATYLREDAEVYARADAFLLLGSAEWTDARQALLEAALLERPRPVYVGNPDIVAPRETGFSVEPGYYAHRLADRTGVQPQFFGKPFGTIYDLAFARLGPVARDRVLMVGDSLHTDVLGAQAAGIASALVAGYGFFAGHDILTPIERSGIRPDFILDRP